MSARNSNNGNNNFPARDPKAAALCPDLDIDNLLAIQERKSGRRDRMALERKHAERRNTYN